MRNVLVVALVLALVGLAGTASAQTKVRSWDDLDWWAQSGATQDPVQDSRRSGYWWWPTEPASNEGDSELWGNRGVVYAQMPTPPHVPPPPPPPPPAPVPVVSRTVPVLNHVLFDFDKSVLKAEGKAAVDQAVAAMKDHPGDTVVIEGHTCNVGASDYNMGLGQRRADAVKKYMVDSGVADGRVRAVSKGEDDPAVSNDTPASRKLNRRAVFKYSIGD